MRTLFLLAMVLAIFACLGLTLAEAPSKDVLVLPQSESYAVAQHTAECMCGCCVAPVHAELVANDDPTAVVLAPGAFGAPTGAQAPHDLYVNVPNTTLDGSRLVQSNVGFNGDTFKAYLAQYYAETTNTGRSLGTRDKSSPVG